MAQQNKNQPKAKTGLARCLELASGHKGLVFLSGFLAALAAICSFVPYLSIYYIDNGDIILKKIKLQL